MSFQFKDLYNESGGSTDSMTIGTLSLPSLAANSVLQTNSVSTVTTGLVDLTSQVTGVLPVANGGTNSSTALANNQLVCSLAGKIVELGSATDGQLLIARTAALPSWRTVTTTTGMSLPAATSWALDTPQDLRTTAGPLFASLTLGGTLSAAGATITGLTASMPVKTNASKQLVSSLISLTTDISGVLPVTLGGTNSSTALNNNRMMVSTAGAIVEMNALTDGQLLIGKTGAAPSVTTITSTTGMSVPTAGAWALDTPQDLRSTATPTFVTTKISGATASQPVKTDASKNLVSSLISLTTDISGILPIANGGTNATTATAAMTNLSPLTTKGDLLTYSTLNARLAVGTDTYYLVADSTQTTGMKWQAPNPNLTLAAIGSVANANGMTLATNTLNLQPASASFGGVVTTGTQTFAGLKTFSTAPNLSSLTASQVLQLDSSKNIITLGTLSGANTGDITLTTIGSTPNVNGASLSGQQLQLQPADGTHGGVLTAGTQTIGGLKTLSADATSTFGNVFSINNTQASPQFVTFIGQIGGTQKFSLSYENLTNGIGIANGTGNYILYQGDPSPSSLKLRTVLNILEDGAGNMKLGGSLTLPTAGGTATALNAYSELNQTFTWAASAGTLSVQTQTTGALTRIGRKVTLTMSNMGGTLSSAATYFTSNFPSTYWVNTSNELWGFLRCTSSATAIGIYRIFTTGEIRIYYEKDGAIAWPATSGSGWNAFCLSWSV